MRAELLARRIEKFLDISDDEDGCEHLPNESFLCWSCRHEIFVRESLAEIRDAEAAAAQRGAELPDARTLAMAEKRLRIRVNEFVDEVARVLITSDVTYQEIEDARRYLNALAAIRARRQG
jgi:hypothetical protein